MLDKCPKTYIKWTFLITGMIAGFMLYLVLLNFNLINTPDGESTILELYTIQQDTRDSSIVLTEHINEEDDYDKPVCKRLEESGERYDDVPEDYYGEI